MSEDHTNSSWWEKVTYSWRNRRRLFLTPFCALLALCGFVLPWIGGSFLDTNAAGWQMALNEASKDLFFLPGLVPGALTALWLVPVTALVLFGAGSARLLWMDQRWPRLWGCGLTGVCLVLMGSFCFPLFPPSALQYLRDRNLQVGFWLTAGALLLSALCSLFPDPLWWIKETRQQAASEALETNVSRRQLLSRAANLGGMLVVASATGLDLGWLSRPHVTPYRMLSFRTLLVPPQGMRALVWSPDNTSLLECLSGVLRSWEIATDQITRTYASPFPPSIVDLVDLGTNPFSAIALSSDGRTLAAAMDTGFALWEVASGHIIQSLALSQQELALQVSYNGVAWSPDGLSLATSKQVFTANSNNQAAALFILRASDLQQQAIYPLSDIPRTIAWSPDGRMLAMGILTVTTLTDTVEVWDVSRGKKIWTYQAPNTTSTFEGHTGTFGASVKDIAWAPDSQHLAISLGDDTDDQGAPVLIWNIVENRQVGVCQGHWGSANGLAWSPDGTRIAAAGGDSTVQVWNARTQERLLVYQGHRDEVWSVAWSPDGAYIASGSYDRTIQVWQAPRLS